MNYLYKNTVIHVVLPRKFQKILLTQHKLTLATEKWQNLSKWNQGHDFDKKIYLYWHKNMCLYSYQVAMD